jgi:hypothetical protein
MSNEIILSICVTAFVLNVLTMAKAVFSSNVANGFISFVGAACALLGIINMTGGV